MFLLRALFVYLAALSVSLRHVFPECYRQWWYQLTAWSWSDRGITNSSFLQNTGVFLMRVFSYFSFSAVALNCLCRCCVLVCTYTNILRTSSSFGALLHPHWACQENYISTVRLHLQMQTISGPYSLSINLHRNTRSEVSPSASHVRFLWLVQTLMHWTHSILLNSLSVFTMASSSILVTLYFCCCTDSFLLKKCKRPIRLSYNGA